jgi:voltage-gated potassium channel Kch
VSNNDKYLITANVNIAPRAEGMSYGYQPGHPVATVGYYDVEAADWTLAAEAAYAIGNRMGADTEGQEWPSDVRSLSVGDVLYVSRNSDSAYKILAVARAGWTEIEQPKDHLQVELAGTEATSREKEL